MKYPLYILRKLIKNDFFRLSILFVFLFLCNVIVIFILPRPILLHDIELMLGIFSIHSSMLGYLWFVFQFVFLIYFIFRFCFYEIDNSYEFICLRISIRKMILYKFLVITGFILKRCGVWN